MKIAMIALGSTGDVRPYIVLGRELKRRGHDITICAFSTFEDAARAEGFNFSAINGDVKKIMDKLMDGSSGVKYLQQVVTSIEPIAEPFMDSLLASCKGTECIIGNFFGHLFSSFAEYYHVPFIQTQYFVMDANSTIPISSAPTQKAGKAFNLISYPLGYLLISALEKFYLDGWRKKNGLAPQKLITTPMYQLNGHDVPVLYAISPLIFPRPREWGDNIYMTGYWQDRLAIQNDYQPDLGLVDFLNAGSKPVYIGFGSMVNGNVTDTLEIVIDAVEKSGSRAVLSSGWGGAEIPKRNDIYVADFVPHDWLFTKMAAVIHHGGAGTTAAGIMACCPTLIIPFGGDQLFWGNRVYSLGIGPKPLPREHLTKQRLARSITDLMTNRKYRIVAKEIGQRLAMENGVKNAADLIEHELRKWLRLEGREPIILRDGEKEHE